MEFPYKEYETHPIWAIVEKTINDLKKNDDIELKTANKYIVGYICKSLVESDQIKIEIKDK
jgi:hypothetical protein